MSTSSLFTLISKALSSQLLCPFHSLPLSHLSRTLQLSCPSCYSPHQLHPLQSFFQSPISLILWYNNNQITHSPHWFQKNIQQNIESKFETSKNVLRLYLKELKETVGKYCDRVIEEYEEIVERIRGESKRELGRLQRVNEMYCRQLEEEINQNPLTIQFLATLITNFLTLNQNPCTSLTSQIHSISQSLSRFPYLNTNSLTSHFQLLCDPLKWKLSNFTLSQSPSHHSPLLDQPNSIHLADNLHYLKYSQQGISIYSYLNNKSPISVCRVPIDDCQEISGYRVLGYSAEQIVMFSYLNVEDVKVVGRVGVRFPIEVEWDGEWVGYKAEGVKWRWDGVGEPETVGKRGLGSRGSSQFGRSKEEVWKENKEPVELNIQNNFVTLS